MVIQTTILRKLLYAFFAFLPIVGAMVGCGGSGEQQIDREAIREEMEQREIKRLLPAELVEGAYQRGEALAEAARDLVLQTYPQPVEEPPADFVTDVAVEKIDSLSKAEDVSIAWVSEITDTAGLEEKEKQLWEAYLYNVDNDLPLNDNVQRIGDEEYLYTKPLLLDLEIRRNMLGSESDTTAFLGMWSILISKKNLIQSMEAP